MTSLPVISRTILPPLVLLSLAIFVGLEARSLSLMGAIFPTTIAVTLGLFCLLTLGQSAWKLYSGHSVTDAPDPEAPETTIAPTWWRGIALMAVLVMWLVLMYPLGLYVSSLLAFIALTIISDDDGFSLRRILISSVCGAIGISLMIQLMTRVLQIPIPKGTWF
ncbi:MAG: tripartite tricarboxylate transporter TctB family protein [Xanthobacter sp.]